MNNIMRIILAGLAAAMLCLPAKAQWTKLDEVHVSTRPASSRGDIFWSSLNSIVSPVPLTRNQWNVIDVTTLGVPANAKAIFLSGNLLISHANAGAFAPLALSALVDSTGYVDSGGTVRAQGIVTLNGSVQRVVNETANLKVAFRAFGDTTDISSCITCQWYLGHSIEVDTGQRSTWATWVPVTAGKIEMKFECKDGHTATDALSACGINLNVQAWGR